MFHTYGAALTVSIGLSLVSWGCYPHDGKSARYETISRLFWPPMETALYPRAKRLLLPESFYTPRSHKSG